MSEQCTLISDAVDDYVQLTLGFMALCSLYGKWYYEHPRRAFLVWFLDAMKQGTSAMMIHFLNIFLAIGIADDSTKVKDADQCAFYFMNVVIDTTIGVYIGYRLLLCLTSLAFRFNWSTLKHPGRYTNQDNEISWRIWFNQLLGWSAVLFVMKVIVGGIIYCFRTPLGVMGYVLFVPVHSYPKIELLIVMIGCPLVMNMVQFWLQDSFLKDPKSSGHAHHENEILPLVGTPQQTKAVELLRSHSYKIHVDEVEKMNASPTMQPASSGQAPALMYMI